MIDVVTSDVAENAAIFLPLFRKKQFVTFGSINAAALGCVCVVLKTKNFHWHMSGPHFCDYHLLLDDQSDQIFAMTDAIAERARKIGGTTLRSFGQFSRFQRILDNDDEYVKPLDMLTKLLDDNAKLIRNMREVHSHCEGR
jgi:starvation-inducible DNA-binding protein